MLDEVVISLFKGPRSYTGEDVVEISCHGSPYVQQQVIGACVELGAYFFRIKDVGPTDTAGLNAAGEVVYPKDMPDYIKGKLNPYKSRSGGVV